MRWSITGFVGPAAMALAISAAPGQPPVPPGVKVERNLAYVSQGSRRQKLDLYRPTGAKGPLPVLLWVHGGAWQAGSKDFAPPVAAGYVKRGFAVASIGYRLSDEAIFPAQILDCKAAVRWLRANAGQYGLDPERFAAWGSSAGGHLVALLGTAGKVAEFDQGEHLEQSSAVQAVVDYFGPTDLVAMVTTPGFEGHALFNSPESKLIGGTVLDHQELARKASPITYVSAETPPFFIAHGRQDRTVPVQQSELLHQALQQHQRDSQLEILPDAGHGGREFMEPALEKQVAAFLERLLKKR